MFSSLDTKPCTFSPTAGLELLTPNPRGPEMTGSKGPCTSASALSPAAYVASGKAVSSPLSPLL